MKLVLVIIACALFSCVNAQEVLPLYNGQIPVISLKMIRKRQKNPKREDPR